MCLVPTSVHHNNFDPANPIGCIENNPLIPRNCTITRPPPITRPCRSPVVLRPPLESAPPASALQQADELLAKVNSRPTQNGDFFFLTKPVAPCP